MNNNERKNIRSFFKQYINDYNYNPNDSKYNGNTPASTLGNNYRNDNKLTYSSYSYYSEYQKSQNKNTKTSTQRECKCCDRFGFPKPLYKTREDALEAKFNSMSCAVEIMECPSGKGYHLTSHPRFHKGHRK